MINTNELRIGNYVIHNNKIIKTTHIVLAVYFMLHDKNNIKTSEELNPIKITEEWLLKFGFEHEIDSGNNDIMTRQGNNFYLKYINLAISENGFYYYSDSLYCGHILIKYIHQLQNLYYSLTGNELIYVPNSGGEENNIEV